MATFFESYDYILQCYIKLYRGEVYIRMQYTEIPLGRELFKYFAMPGRLNGLKAASWTIPNSAWTATNSECKCRYDKEVELFLSNRGTLIVYGSDTQIDYLIAYLEYVLTYVI